MTGDEYMKTILAKYAVNTSGAMASGRAIYPVLQQWGNVYLNSADFSGSLAKGTSVSIGTDADIFLSLSSTTPGTLADMYDSLYKSVTAAGYTARKQNVSIGIVVNGHSIDLVPGRRHSQYGSDHSLYKNKSGSWTQTNVAKHISFVKNSGRTDEIKILKVWRELHGLVFPSFFLEMAVIDALQNSKQGNLAANVSAVLDHLGGNIKTVKYIDPSNSNNVISDDCTQAEKNALAIQASISRAEPFYGKVVW